MYFLKYIFIWYIFRIDYILLFKIMIKQGLRNQKLIKFFFFNSEIFWNYTFNKREKIYELINIIFKQFM